MLKQKYPNAVFTKEPGGTKIGVQIRQMLLEGERLDWRTEYLLFLADRARHVHDVIEPNRHALIFSDRSVISGIAYANKNIQEEFLLRSTLFAVDDVLPDFAIILQLKADELLKRLSQKSTDRIEERGIEYLLAVQEQMCKAAQLLGIRYEIVDAGLSIEEINQKITRLI
jgi:dTMP kinase